MSTALTGQTTPADGQGTPPAAGGDAGNQDWRSALPEDIRSEKVFESIKGKDITEALPVLAKNYLNAQRLVGADKVVIPGKDATPEQLAEFRKKIGVPEKPEDYAVTPPEGVDPASLNQEVLSKWRTRMHEAGITKAAAEKIINDYLADEVALTTQSAEQKAKQQQEWVTQLREAFGDKFDAKINIAQYALKEFGSENLVKWLEESGAGNHPDVVQFFAKVGDAMSDDSVRKGLGTPSGPPKTAAAAQAALNEFNNSEAKQKALWDSNHPQHDAVVKERNDLFQMAFPTEE